MSSNPSAESPCYSAVERTPQQQTADQVVGHVASDALGAEMQPEDSASSRRRFNHPNRAASEIPLAQQLQPGLTMAEICALDAGEMYCRTGTYAAISNHAGERRSDLPDPERTISGRVMTANGDGLPGMTIVASPDRISGRKASDFETLRFWTTSNMFGAYAFQGLPKGEYTIRSSNAGKHLSARTAARTGVDYADLVVPESAVMLASGRVLTPMGEPLEGVTVLPVLPGQPSVLSDITGKFELPVALKETAKSFAIRFQRPGFNEAVVRVDYLDQSAGFSAIDVVMEPVESWILVSGTVLGDSGSPLADRKIVLRPTNGQQNYKAKTDRDGTFTFPSVESPASYRLIVQGDAHHKDFEQLVHVHPQLDPLDVVVESWEFGKLTGQLRNGNGAPVPDFELVLRNDASSKPVGVLTTDSMGNFEVPKAPAGTLVISSQSTPHLLVQGLEVDAGGSQHVDLTLDWGDHAIRGIVADSQGAPVPASQVVLQWISKADGGITSRATRRTAADLDGRFSFSNLGPGPHVLRVSAPGFHPVDIEHDLSRQGYETHIRLYQSVSNRIDPAWLRNREIAASTRGYNTSSWQESPVNNDSG